MARRSLPIFSRKGVETPEPTPPFIDQAAMPSPKRMSERQKSWINRKSTGRSKKEKVNGTILKVVPAANIPPLSALEEAMATSPNEEILSAISMHAPADAFNPTSAIPTRWWNRSTTTIAQPQHSSSQRRRDTNSRIGVWANGVAQWESEARECQPGRMENSSAGNFTVFASVSSYQAGDGADRSIPTLSIPGRQQRAMSDQAVVAQPRPSRVSVSVAPASIASKFNISPPNTVFENGPPSVVSPIDATSSGTSTPPAHRSHALVSLHPNDVPASDGRPTAPTRSSSSSSSVVGVEGKNYASVYSHRSSMTSLEAQEAEITPRKASGEDDLGHLNFPQRSNSNAFSTGSPTDAGIFDDATSVCYTSTGQRNIFNKPLPPNSSPLPIRSAPAPPSSPTSTNLPIDSRRIRQSKSTKSAAGGTRARTHRPALMPSKSTKSLSSLDAYALQFIKSSPYARDFSAPASPTLSEAEEDLSTHLSTIKDAGSPRGAVPLFVGQIMRKGDYQAGRVENIEEPEAMPVNFARSGSVRSVMHPPERAPTLPKKSRKREWRASRAARQHVGHLATAQVKQPTRMKSAPKLRESPFAPEAVPAVLQLRKAKSDAALPRKRELAQVLRSADTSKTDTDIAPLPTPTIVIDDSLCVVEGPVVIPSTVEEDNEEPAIPIASTAAESVLLDILSALNSLGDLFNTAMINKGMYRVFKENELSLIRNVNHNQSPASWEFREWCPPERNNETDSSSKASSQLEHSPKTYMLCHHRDKGIMKSLKKLILAPCQSFMRRETAFALSSASHPQAQRFDDAFWRIWCFCTIFGSKKGREHDITGQLDWLKGGILANQLGCVATVNTSLDFDMSSVLLNPPDHFAMGNASGLSAQQLYDMTELWTNLNVLLQGYHGRVEQARAHGVFDGTNVVVGDVEKEEAMLEEWTFCLLTHGPSAVLEMAEYATDSSAAGFALAKEHGWTSWTPPMYSRSRSTFLKEPVSRLYEERVAAAALKLLNPREQEMKEMSRKRVATLAAEIRLSRQTSGFKRLPLIDMNSERPMSIMSRHDSTMSTTSVRSMSSARGGNPRSSTSAAPNSSMQGRPMWPTSLWSAARISPSIEDHVEKFNRMSLHSFGGLAEHTEQTAVNKITEMGFTEWQAREALNITDMGDRLRVDRAVDMLLRQQ